MTPETSWRFGLLLHCLPNPWEVAQRQVGHLQATCSTSFWQQLSKGGTGPPPPLCKNSGLSRHSQRAPAKPSHTKLTCGPWQIQEEWSGTNICRGCLQYLTGRGRKGQFCLDSMSTILLGVSSCHSATSCRATHGETAIPARLLGLREWPCLWVAL